MRKSYNFLSYYLATLSREKAQEMTGNLEDKRKEYSELRQAYKDGKKKFKEIQQKAMENAPLEDEDGNPTALKETLNNELDQFDEIEHAEVSIPATLTLFSRPVIQTC